MTDRAAYAKQRFEEDALRILRALRFSSTLDFTIEKETEINELKKYVSEVFKVSAQPSRLLANGEEIIL